MLVWTNRSNWDCIIFSSTFRSRICLTFLFPQLWDWWLHPLSRCVSSCASSLWKKAGFKKKKGSWWKNFSDSTFLTTWLELMSPWGEYRKWCLRYWQVQQLRNQNTSCRYRSPSSAVRWISLEEWLQLSSSAWRCCWTGRPDRWGGTPYDVAAPGGGGAPLSAQQTRRRQLTLVWH